MPLSGGGYLSGIRWRDPPPVATYGLKGRLGMVSGKAVIMYAQGLHARPANQFVKECQRYECEITIVSKGKSINAKSILGVLSAGISCGSEIEIACNCQDEGQALSGLLEFLAEIQV